MSYEGENIWIIGASSGIGRSLAFILAGLGANLILTARSKDRLQRLAKELGQKHPDLTITPCVADVSNEAEVKKAVSSFSAKGMRIDRIIFMAAIYEPPSVISEINIQKARQILDVNLMGATIISKLAFEVFNKQQSGQLALCASVAGYIGLPRGQIYSASKAAIINLAETIASEAPDYMDIKLISPGFVDTPMTEKNDFQMPMIISPEKAATHIANELKSAKFEIHFPKKFTLFMKLLKVLPYALSLRLTRKMTP